MKILAAIALAACLSLCGVILIYLLLSCAEHFRRRVWWREYERRLDNLLNSGDSRRKRP